MAQRAHQWSLCIYNQLEQGFFLFWIFTFNRRVLELYARLFAKIKENYALRREIQTRLKPKRRLIRQQIIEENIGACICDLATGNMQSKSLANTLILAAGDKKDLGNSFLSWRPSVFSLNLGKRDRTESGESRVTVSSVYSTSTVTSLADSGVKAGVNCEHCFKKT